MISDNVIDTLDSLDAAFSSFMKLSYDKLYWYACSLLTPSAAHAAEDLVQEAYTRVYESMRRGATPFRHLEYKNKYSPLYQDMMRYMHVVIKNNFIDMIQQRYSNESSLDVQLMNDRLLQIQDLDEYSNIERLVLHQESSAELSAYIDKLPQSMQQIIRLKLDGFTSQEIAKRLSKRPGTVRVSIMRATRLLREMMIENSQSHLIDHPQNFADSNILPAVRNGIAQLPDPYKSVVAFCMLKNMSYTEISNMLHKSVGTIKSQYYRGKRKLQVQSGHDALQSNSDQDLSETVLACLPYAHRLDRHLREVVELHYVQRLSYSKIAKELGRPKGTIQSWVSRAMESLRQYANPQSVTSPVKSSSSRHSGFTEEELEYIEKGIPPAYRDIMRKRYIELLSIEDIAVALDIPKARVASKIKAGKRLVKEHACKYKFELIESAQLP